MKEDRRLRQSVGESGPRRGNLAPALIGAAATVAAAAIAVLPQLVERNRLLEIARGAGNLVQRDAPLSSWTRSGEANVWWHCRMADGFELFAIFRSKRSVADVTAYFPGQSAGDCDSWYWGRDCERDRVCLPRDIVGLVRAHGPIIFVGTLARAPECAGARR